MDKQECVDVNLLTEVTWYPDKTYDVKSSEFYRDQRIYCNRHFCGEYGSETIWKIKCNKIFFRSIRHTFDKTPECPDGFCGAGRKIISLTKCVFQYQGDSLITLYNPQCDKNGSITMKSDLGDFNLDQISGIEGGVNCKFRSGLMMHRFIEAFPQQTLTIRVYDTDVSNKVFPFNVANSKFKITAGPENYRNDTILSNLTITEYKNDTLKGRFSAKMNINRNWHTKTTDPDVFNITEGTFSMRMYNK